MSFNIIYLLQQQVTPIILADEKEDLSILQTRLQQRDLLLTAPLIGENLQTACELENRIVQQHCELIE